MTRRYALAAALAITTVITFMMIVTGTRAGLFGGSNGGDGSGDQAAMEASPEEVAGALRYLAALQASRTPAPVAQVVAEPQVYTEYVYLYEAVTPPGAPTAPPARFAAASATPAVPAPTEPVQEPTPIPSRTPAATPTTAGPSPTVPPPAPTSPPPGPSELEFTGTVTAITGDQVTWSYGGGTVTTRVVKDLGSLQVGTVAKVHALWVGTGYVAKELELKG